VKAWVFPYKGGLACPDSRPGQILVQREGDRSVGIVAYDGRGGSEPCRAVEAVITYDDGKPARRRKGGKRLRPTPESPR
jgi:hypothetical protein